MAKQVLKKPLAKRILKAIPGTGGIISKISLRTGHNWFIVKREIDNSPELTLAWNEEREKILDMAEVGLITSIKNGDQGDRKFYLATQGKHRGYSEKMDIGLNGPIEIKIVYEEQGKAKTEKD